jgi:hypothetical protein
MGLYLDPVRDEHGVPVCAVAAYGRALSGRKLHDYRCFLLGITDPDAVAELWRLKEQARPPAAAAPGRKRVARRGT